MLIRISPETRCPALASPPGPDVAGLPPTCLRRPLVGLLPDASPPGRGGFVFQYGELLPEVTSEESTALALRRAGQRNKPAPAAAGQVLDRLGLGELRERRPSREPGGQSRCAAVARALVHRPAVVFADEPTGSLDSANVPAVQPGRP